MNKIPAIVKVGTLQQRLRACVGVSEAEIHKLADRHAPPRKDEPWDLRNQRLRHDMHLRGEKSTMPTPDQLKKLEIGNIVLAASGKPLLDTLIFETGVKQFVSYDGDDHEVFCDTIMARAVKLTKPTALAQGIQNYVDCIAKMNEVFADQIKIEGWIINVEGQPSIVTSQPWIPGKKPNVEEIESYMRQLHFHKATDTLWYREQDDLWISGVTDSNIIVDQEKNAYAIDLKVHHLSQEEEVKYRQIITRQPQPEVVALQDYSADPISLYTSLLCKNK
jgi:hypothetical protein